MRYALGIVAAACSVLPWASAQAQGVSERAYTNYCTTGALHACASVIVKTAWSQSAGATFVTVYVRNEQGSNWGYDNTGGSSVARLWVWGPPSSATGQYIDIWSAGWTDPGLLGGGYNVDRKGNVAVYGVEPGSWDTSPTGLNSRSLMYVAPYNQARGIFGCKTPLIDPTIPTSTVGGPPYGGGYGTCASGGYDGWVALRFAGPSQFTASDLSVGWDVASNARDWASCDTLDPAACAQVTPEPMTLVLVGTGLAGLGAVYRRRRKGGELG